MRIATDPRLVLNVHATLVAHARLRDTRHPQRQNA